MSNETPNTQTALNDWQWLGEMHRKDEATEEFQTTTWIENRKMNILHAQQQKERELNRAKAYLRP